MLYLLQDLSSWFASALALGVVAGLIACGGAQAPRWSGWALPLVLTYVAGVAAAFLHFAPGRYGFWLESGLLIFTSYCLGSLLGCILRRLFRSPAEPAVPEWVGAARDLIRQAEAFVAAAPGALAANQDAAAEIVSEPEMKPAAIGSSPAPATPALERPPRLGPPGTESALFAALHGIDRQSALALRAMGVGGASDLAGLSSDQRRATAEQLGADEDVITYWTMQARLLSCGIALQSDWEANADAAAPLDAATARALIASLPQIVGPQAIDALYPGERPLGLLAPPEPGADDLGRIVGLDPATVQRLQALGVWTFAQIAAWTEDNMRWTESYLAAPGRIAREGWRNQSRSLARRPPIAI